MLVNKFKPRITAYICIAIPVHGVDDHLLNLLVFLLLRLTSCFHSLLTLYLCLVYPFLSIHDFHIVMLSLPTRMVPIYSRPCDSLLNLFHILDSRIWRAYSKAFIDCSWKKSVLSFRFEIMLMGELSKSSRVMIENWTIEKMGSKVRIPGQKRLNSSKKGDLDKIESFLVSLASHFYYKKDSLLGRFSWRGFWTFLFMLRLFTVK